MTNNERQSRIGRLSILPSYLAELATLVGRKVSADELLSIQETALLRERLKQVPRELVVRTTIPFEARTSVAFGKMLDDLRDLNPSHVVLWPPKANDCGVLPVGSLREVNFGFPFDLNSEGILAIATSDGLNSLLLDFSDEGNGQRSLEIELKGMHWARAELSSRFAVSPPPAPNDP